MSIRGPGDDEDDFVVDDAPEGADSGRYDDDPNPYEGTYSED